MDLRQQGASQLCSIKVQRFPCAAGVLFGAHEAGITSSVWYGMVQDEQLVALECITLPFLIPCMCRGMAFYATA